MLYMFKTFVSLLSGHVSCIYIYILRERERERGRERWREREDLLCDMLQLLYTVISTYIPIWHASHFKIILSNPGGPS